MRLPVRFLYHAAVGAVRLATPLAPLAGAKVARAVRGRRASPGALAAWARAARDPLRPLIWVHAPSVGEAHQARAVLARVRARRPEVQVVFTHFSPSAEGVAAALGADVHAYLPWDAPGVLRPLLAALEPSAVVFTKTEVWPVLADEARAAGAAVGLVAATLTPGSGRLRWPARAVLGSTWRHLTFVSAVDEASGAGFATLGVPPERIRVDGDPAVDAALDRLATARADAPHVAAVRRGGGDLVVAGSTWPPDEDVVFSAFSAVRRGGAPVRLVVAPHEPEAARVRGLLERTVAGGFRAATLAEVESDPGRTVDVVVVERVGVLAELYRPATVAYVGGGFGSAGLHSVVEPAAAGVPVLFGPRHHRAPAATGLLEAGAARVVSSGEELREALEAWRNTSDERDYAAAAATRYILGQRGAAARAADRVLTHITP